jgi:hypothetical protein
LQNFACEGRAVPHVGQARARATPHSRQNLLPDGFSAPHAEQRICHLPWLAERIRPLGRPRTLSYQPLHCRPVPRMQHCLPLKDVPCSSLADPDSLGNPSSTQFTQFRPHDPPPTIVVVVDGQPLVQLVDRQQALNRSSRRLDCFPHHRRPCSRDQGPTWRRDCDTEASALRMGQSQSRRGLRSGDVPAGDPPKARHREAPRDRRGDRALEGLRPRRIRAGKFTPHVSTWSAFGELVGVEVVRSAAQGAVDIHAVPIGHDVSVPQ